MNSSPERDEVIYLAAEMLKEWRRSRRWKLFFKLTWLVLIIALVSHTFTKQDNLSLSTKTDHAAVIMLEGSIDSESNTAHRMIESLQEAFETPSAKAILILANSPGGSPVLSNMVFDEILRLRALYPNKPIHTVVEEVCASGCYYIAAASDKIFVNPASMVGSIGVLSDSFGFTDVMQKVGIERRLATSGSLKGMNDPFSPQSAEQLAIQSQMLQEVHQQFIAAVQKGRGARLSKDPLVFSGRVYLGSQAIPLGLADQSASFYHVLHNVVKQKDYINYTQEEDWGNRLAKRFGAEISLGIQHFFKSTWR